MKTRFAPIVKFKHSKVQESQARLQEAIARLNKAKTELQKALDDLRDLQVPQTGNMQHFLASRTLLDAQLRLIENHRGWVAFEERQVEALREQLKNERIEYEKFKYLEAQEIKKLQEMQKRKEAKRLDEVALMTFMQKGAI